MFWNRHWVVRVVQLELVTRSPFQRQNDHLVVSRNTGCNYMLGALMYSKVPVERACHIVMPAPRALASDEDSAPRFRTETED